MNMNHPAVQRLMALRGDVQKMQNLNTALARDISAKEIASRQGLKSVNGPGDVRDNLKQVLPKWMMPGNIGDVNKICWPFWFTNITPELPAATGGNASQSKASVTVTQEAAFIITSFTKAVFIHNEDDTFSYVDPLQVGQDALTPGLSMALYDAQSSRAFQDQPIRLDEVGCAEEPTELPTPLLFLPNSIIETVLFNTNEDVAYVPWITFHGVRCRIEDAQRIFSTVTG